MEHGPWTHDTSVLFVLRTAMDRIQHLVGLALVHIYNGSRSNGCKTRNGRSSSVLLDFVETMRLCLTRIVPVNPSTVRHVLDLALTSRKDGKVMKTHVRVLVCGDGEHTSMVLGWGAS